MLVGENVLLSGTCSVAWCVFGYLSYMLSVMFNVNGNDISTDNGFDFWVYLIGCVLIVTLTKSLVRI